MKVRWNRKRPLGRIDRRDTKRRFLGASQGAIAWSFATDRQPLEPTLFAPQDGTQSVVTAGRTEFLQRRSWRRSESSVAARPMAARFFVRVVLAIALARRRGIGRLILLGWLLQRVLHCLFSLFEPHSIKSGLSSSVFFAVFGSAIFQICPGEPPSPSGGLTIATAVPIQGMVRRETTIASLKQTLSGGKTSQFGLRTD